MDGRVVDGLKKEKNKIKKGLSKTIYIVSYALKVNVNGVKCVFVAHFRSSGTSKKILNWLNS